MIDWLKILVPFKHDAPINGGHVMSIGRGGDIEWSTNRRHGIRGSWEAGLQVRSATHTADPCTMLEIDGNPVKFFQGHNLWGTDDLPSLAVATIRAVAEILGIEPSAEDEAEWLAGNVQVLRVDCTESFHLGNKADCLTWLRAAEQTAHLSFKGRGQLTKGTTLYFGKNSRRSTLKIYAKGEEITAKGHKQEAILDLPHAIAWADRSLRAELTVRSMELKRLGLSFVRDWQPVDGVPFAVTSQLLRGCLGNMTMTTNIALSSDILDTLRPAIRLAVQAWESGADLRATLTRPTFYRYRKELLQHGIDVAIPKPREFSNVVPLVRVLEAVPVGVPDWAQGTPLYFEPRRVA